MCLETLAFKSSAMCKITVHVCTWLNKTSRKGNVCVNAVLLALFFCKTFPGSRCDLLKSLIVIEKVILKVIRIHLKYKINHTVLFYFTKQYHGLHGWHSFLEWSVRELILVPQFSSVQLLSRVRLFATPWTTACQTSLSIINSQSPSKLMSIESVMPSSHLILCHPLLLLPSIFPSMRVFSNESALRIRWPKYWSLSFNISPSKEHPGWVSFRMDWLDLLAVQGTLKSLLQHHS